jgi:hypothetical protein
MPEIATAPLPPLELPSCNSVPPPPPQLELDVPFAGKLKSIPNSIRNFQSSDDVLMQFMGQVQTVLAPFMGILALARALQVLFSCMEAIKEAVSKLSPKPIVDCLKEIAKVIPLVFQFIPPLNYVPPYIDIALLSATSIIELITTIQESIQAALDLAEFEENKAQIPQLSNFEGCVNANEESRKEQIAGAVNGLGPFLDVFVRGLEAIQDQLPPVEPFVDKIKEPVESLRGTGAADVGEDLIEILDLLKDILIELRDVLDQLG